MRVRSASRGGRAGPAIAALLAAGGLLARDTRPVSIADWPGLLRAAAFDAGYLHASVA